MAVSQVAVAMEVAVASDLNCLEASDFLTPPPPPLPSRPLSRIIHPFSLCLRRGGTGMALGSPCMWSES